MRWCLTLVLLFAFTALNSQQDSLRFYKRIKRIAVKNKYTKMAYEAVFRDPEPVEYPKEPAGKQKKNVNPFLKVKGRIISRIVITVLDPFGYSLTDTVGNARGLRAWGNRVHMNTNRIVIQNRLLFKKGDTLEPLRLSESERLLRTAVFVNDARISVHKLHRDSVQVNVLVIDKWPLTFPAEVTDMNANAQFRNNNLFGSGQQFEQYAKVNRDLTYYLKAYYNVANIGRTYISSRIGYNYDGTNTNAYLQFDKPFYSFLASWAGGIYVYHDWRKFSYYNSEQSSVRTLPLNSCGYDVWAGKLIKFKKSPTLLNQSSNIITAARYYDNQYLNRPRADLDPGRSFPRRQAALLSAGVAVQQYYKDKYIYRFGSNEDVPEGLLFQVTAGSLWKEYQKVRYYSGFEVARAKHFDIGYFSATLAYGIFYNKKVANDVTTNFNIQYISELFKKRRTYFRQFLSYSILHGENKFENQTIGLSSGDLYGFQSSLSGNTRMILNSETVAYLPYQFIGFRFAPVLMAGLGMIGSPEDPLIKSRLYQGYTLGLMLRNENLLTSTFQVSVGFYPYLPDSGKPAVLYNPVTSFTLRVRGFSVGRPEFVGY